MAKRNWQPRPQGILATLAYETYPKLLALWQARPFFAYLYLWLAVPWLLVFYHSLLRWPGTNPAFVFQQLFSLHPVLLIAGKLLVLGALVEVVRAWNRIPKRSLVWPTVVGLGWSFYLLAQLSHWTLPLPTVWAPVCLWILGALLALALAFPLGLLSKEECPSKG
ncbi:hypothetical protein [Candidatus Methylacidithermus pantelleriae]|uniref:Uncharacterized protein n=1 Tax=Candidatus Methylacidithermus pantelleriae TaxID=2744239 RepID=A0A8J2BPK5_9BACT|nr:hypothetical protein [Candidatus Methylacidithermus pantelleriae]CAF0696989.1 membrane hypothetical protein [Candidatus Methylacidithermus pantelleriae]